MPEKTTDWKKYVEQALAEGEARAVGVNGAALTVGNKTVIGHRTFLVPEAPPEGCPEGVFQDHTRRLFLAHGYAFYHTRRSKGSDPDFPDCVAIRAGAQGWAAELKVKKNKPTPGQLRWLELFASMGFRTAVWYPKDWPHMLEVLK